MSDLSRYAARARSMPIADLRFALSDIRSTLELRRSEGLDPYARKLLDERDAYLSELQRREARGARLTRNIKRAATR